MLKNTFLIFFLLSGILAFTQDFTVEGKVRNQQNISLEFASVSVQNPETYDEVAEAMTDESGSFSVEVPKGSYLLYIESFGGGVYEVPIEVTQNMSLGNITVEEASVVALETATITGSAPVYRMELDKKIYDVSKDDIAKGGSVSDALENVPSVEVDGEGNISLRGSENIRILVDGKPSSLVGISDPATALKNLPADVVDRIEVITNPSARYEAEGSTGIINIVLKKGKLKGFNGSVNAYGGSPTTAGAGANLNYRTEKWNHFTNFSYRYSEWNRSGNSFTTRYNPQGVPTFEDMIQDGKRINNGYNFMLGTEYFMDDKNTFSISGNYRNGTNKNRSSIFYDDYDFDMNPTASSVRTEDEDRDDYSVEGTLGYKHEFDNEGHELTVDLRANYSENNNVGDLREIGNLVDSYERSFNKEYQNRTIISADYVRPLGEKSKLELGARGEMSGTLTDFSVDSLSGNTWTPKTEFNNRTDYKQNVFAGYAQYGRAFGQFSFFAGLRVEHSDITVEAVLENTTVKKDYTDFFPSLFLNYEFESEDQLQLSYSRRIRRPRGWNLIPITSYSNNRSLFMGNPDLDPQYTDSYELSYVGRFGKLMLTPNVYFSHTTNNIQRYRYINEDGVFVMRPINVGTEDRYGADFTFTYRPWRWWNLMGNVNMFGYKTKGQHTDTFEDPVTGDIISKTTNFDGDGFSWFARVNNRFTLPAKINTQLSVFYRGGMKTVQSERKPMIGADLSISKDLFNDDATITLSVRDLFDSRKFKSSSFGDDFFVDSESRWGSRSINLTFTYRFNQSKRDQRRQNQYDDGNGEFEMEGGMM